MNPILISFDLRADFGVFKKPDVNEGMQLTFNMLHRPALLGILGAIAGLEGYQRKGMFTAYYSQLRSIRVGIEPLEPYHEKGNFTKTVIKYTNTIGYANADGNLLVTEQTLRYPAYRCYVMADLENPMHELLIARIKAGEAEYLPYFGKNECAAWWEVDSVKEHVSSDDRPKEPMPVATIFRKENIRVSDMKEDGYEVFDFFDMTLTQSSFMYFERLPVDFDERLFQYRMGEFAYLSFPMKPSSLLDNMVYLDNEKKYAALY
jgi:CRISPR-associated protein Cas5h